MKPQGKFYIIRESRDCFSVNCFADDPLPILCNENGEYYIIPIAVVRNALDNLIMYKKMASKTITPHVFIYREQGIPISNEAGRALMEE